MATLNTNGDAEMTEQVLTDLVCLYPSAGRVRTLKAYDREQGQFLLLDEGWDGYQRLHHVWAHIELRDDKFWIHEDGTEVGIANLLVAKGIPHDRIVLAFQAPALRKSTQYTTV